MPSTYTQNLGLEKPATGEQAGGWGNTANTSYDAIDRAIDGTLFDTLSAANSNLVTSMTGGLSDGQNKVVVWNGTLAAATVTIQPPTAQKLYLMSNQTSGAITLTQGTGGNFVLQPGCDAWVRTDGAGGTARVVGALNNPQFNNVAVTGTMSVNVLTASQLGLGTTTPSVMLDARPPNSVIQVTSCLSALVAGNNNGGGIYLGGDVTASGNPLLATAAIEASWGGATTPQVGIGVVYGQIGGNILMDSNGNTFIRNGGATLLSALGTGHVLVNSTTLVGTSVFEVNGRSRFIDPEPYIICLDYGGGAPVAYIGVGSGGTFQLSNNTGQPLIEVDQSGNAVVVSVLTAASIRSITGGFEFPDGTIQTTAATGFAVTPHVVGRNTSTVYVNNTGKTMIVTACLGMPNGASSYAQIGSGATPNITVAYQICASSSLYANFVFVVPPGWSYAVQSSQGAIGVNYWTEYY